MSSKPALNYWWNTFSLIPCIYVGVPVGAIVFGTPLQYLLRIRDEGYGYYIGGMMGAGLYSIMLRSDNLMGKSFAVGGIIGGIPICTMFYLDQGFVDGPGQVAALAMMSVGGSLIGVIIAMIMRYSNYTMAFMAMIMEKSKRSWRSSVI